MYWSCLPTGRRSRSISIWQASRPGAGGDVLPAVGVDRPEQPDGEGPETEAGPAGDIGQADQLDRRTDRMDRQRLTDDRVVDLLHRDTRSSAEYLRK